jgi:OOP family OmpA-OmpF porin
MNLDLSEARAMAVLEALADRRVPIARISATGYGEAEPIADNDTEAGREANRRIEFRLVAPEPSEAGDGAATPDEASVAETSADRADGAGEEAE